jgi:XRE family transcriptional regulator, master regulator for biofilm formation
LSPKRLSQVIKTVRTKRALTQAQVARKAGVTKNYITMLERGDRKNPSLDIVKKLAKALGVPVTALLG